MSLRDSVAVWDGKSAQLMEQLYLTHADDDDLPETMVRHLADTEVQRGMSWLLKRHLETARQSLPEALAQQILQELPTLQDWQSKLHILQCLAQIPVGRAEAARLERFLRECLLETNKFVRAWAYNGFYLLAMQHGEYEAEARQLLTMALRDEPASVKARVRNVLKNWPETQQPA